MSLSLDDFTQAESQESVEETTENATEEVVAESNETEEASSSEPETLAENQESNEDAVAESYEADFTYKVKDEVKEFPEFIREAIKSKEHEEQIRDYFTKADAIDGIKESRSQIEEQFNTYRAQVEEQVAPTINRIKEFEGSIQQGNYTKAMEMSGMEPEKLVDSLLMDEKLSDMVYKKVLEQVNLEEQGPQAVEARRQAYQESLQKSQLETQNQTLEQRIQQMEQASFDQMLQFTMSQHQDVVSKYDQSRGQQGAFENLVRDLGHMKYMKGEKLQPAQVVQEAIQMLGLQANTNTNPTNSSPEATPAPKKPAVLPQTGMGSNASVVGKSASTWEDFTKQLAV